VLQLLRWGKKRPREPAEVDFTLAAEEHLNGLLAALAVLYGNEELFREVPQQDLVSAVVYGDQLAIPRAVELGMQLLTKAAAAGQAGLTQECCRALASLPSWPACMLPLLPAVAARVDPRSAAEQQQVYQGALVAALGNLEAVWVDKQLRKLLLGLPLPAVELLLSSDLLRVVSEDTVLYTALRCVEHIDSIKGSEAAKEALSKCIRCVQLSNHCLLGHVVPAADLMVLSFFKSLFRKQQQRLLLGMFSLRQVSTEHCLAQMSRQDHANQVPKAWLLPARAHLVAPSPVSVTWRVAVADIKKSCRQTASQTDEQAIIAAVVSHALVSDTLGSGYTGPLYGTCFAINMLMSKEPAGVEVGVYVQARHFFGPYLSARISLAAPSLGITRTMNCLSSQSSGWRDFFGVGPMGGDGWDQAAWAAKGLPLEGHIQLKLTVGPL
jgi:hypothetical protein